MFFRLSQILLVAIIALREYSDVLTNIQQFHTVSEFAYKILSFPTQKNAALKYFGYATPSMLLAKTVIALIIIFHFLIAIILTIGCVVLLRQIKQAKPHFHELKKTCVIGLGLGLIFYIFVLGFFAMDVYLSWMHGMDFNLDIAGCVVPIGFRGPRDFPSKKDKNRWSP